MTKYLRHEESPLLTKKWHPTSSGSFDIPFSWVSIFELASEPFSMLNKLAYKGEICYSSSEKATILGINRDKELTRSGSKCALFNKWRRGRDRLSSSIQTSADSAPSERQVHKQPVASHSCLNVHWNFSLSNNL